MTVYLLERFLVAIPVLFVTAFLVFGALHLSPGDPVDMIVGPIAPEHIRERVRTLEDTLASFGVPAKVVEVNQGPTITQFGVEPGYIERRASNGRVTRSKIKVSKIANLVKDGRTNKEIASMLYLSENTVKNHRSQIRNKLGLKHKKINLRSYLRSLD